MTLTLMATYLRLLACLFIVSAGACDKSSPSEPEEKPAATQVAETVGTEDLEAEQLLGSQTLDWLVSGEFAALRKTFDGAMLEAFPDDASLAKWWADILRQTGRFRVKFATATQVQGAHTVVRIACIFAHAPQDLQILIDQEGQVAGLGVAASENPDVRPQTPQAPFPYASKEVAYENTGAGTTIAGTITLPEGSGPHPAVLLISGSGSQDRDGTMAGHKTFLVIADHLSRRGFVVLRVDDRGVGGSSGDPNAETMESIALDVEASLAFLSQQEAVDPKRIGLVGHSVGGLVAPMVAVRSKQVAFVVSLAGPGISGVELIPLQVGLLLKAKGIEGETNAKVVAAHKVLTPLLARDAPEKELAPAIEDLANAAAEVAPEGKTEIGEALRVAIREKVRGPWHRSFAKSKPADHLGRLRVPILMMFGERDTIVPAEVNQARASQIFATNKESRERLETLPKLNHLFQRAETGFEDEYVMQTVTVDSAALEMMTEWLQKTTTLGAPKGKP